LRQKKKQWRIEHPDYNSKRKEYLKNYYAENRQKYNDYAKRKYHEQKLKIS